MRLGSPPIGFERPGQAQSRDGTPLALLSAEPVSTRLGPRRHTPKLESPSMQAVTMPSISEVGSGGTGAIRLKDFGPLRLAIAGLMLITVSRAHDYLGIVAALRPGILFFGGALLCLAIFPQKARFKNLLEEWPSKAIIALVIVSCLSALTGLSVTASGAFLLETFTRLLSFFGLLVVVIRTVQDLRFLTATYVLALLVLVYIVIFVAGTQSFDGYQRIGDTAMYDGNDLGVVFLVGLPLAVLMAQAGGRVARLLGWLAIVGIPICIVLTASRGAFLGLVATAATLWVLIPRMSLMVRVSLPVVGVLFMAVAAPEGYWDKMSTILAPQADYNLTSDTGRLAIWTRGMGYVAEYPVFGVGPNNFLRAGWEISGAARSNVGLGLRDQAPHNTFLQVWAELGTVGLVVWLTILFGGMVAPLVVRARMSRSWLDGTPNQRFLYLAGSYLPASFVAFAITTFFVSHAYTGMFYIFAAFLSGFLLLARRELEQIGTEGRTRRTARPQSMVQNGAVEPPRVGPGPAPRWPTGTTPSSGIPLPRSANASQATPLLGPIRTGPAERGS